MDQLSGVLVTRKPEGMNSRQFGVDEAKSFIAKQDLKPMKRKIGHLGTLDPFASGVLPVMIGSATKLGNHLMLEPKRYKATLKLGYETDTGDHTGTLVDNDLAKVTIDDLMLRDVESSMTGSIKQVSPFILEDMCTDVNRFLPNTRRFVSMANVHTILCGQVQSLKCQNAPLKCSL